MRSVLILSLAVLPPLLVATWTWLQLRRAERQLGSVEAYRTGHFAE